jgi:hypothetical protein
MKTVQLRRPVRHIDIRYVWISEPIIDTLLPLTAVAVLAPDPLLVGFHIEYKTARTHVGPVPLDVLQARRSDSRPVDHIPTCRDVGKVRPERVLVLVVTQHEEDAVFVVEGVVHRRPFGDVIAAAVTGLE